MATYFHFITVENVFTSISGKPELHICSYPSSGNKGEMFVGLMGRRSIDTGEKKNHFN